LNQFYRNRLVRCYLGATKLREDRRPHPFTGFDFQDDLPMTDLAVGDYPGPFPLINTALNTAQGGDLDAQERQGGVLFDLTAARGLQAASSGGAA
jgi:hypothetical protein